MGSQAVHLYSAFGKKKSVCITLFLLVASKEGEKYIHIYLHVYVYNKIPANLKLIFNLVEDEVKYNQENWANKDTSVT